VKRRVAVCSIVALLGAVTAGCSSAGSTKPSAGSSTTAPTTTPSPSAPPSTPATSTTSAAPCTTTELSVSIGQGGGAAGTAHIPLVFTNTGSANCTLHGYPGVSVVGASGNQIGPAASRTSSATPPSVTLASGATTTAVVTLSDVLNSCPNPATPDGFRIYPPDQTTALYAPSGTLQIGPIGIGIGG
jgi:hypothetical protein